ncbi:MAG: hypothetical protein AAF702_40625 [Chloroflexota bacterium]
MQTKIRKNAIVSILTLVLLTAAAISYPIWTTGDASEMQSSIYNDAIAEPCVGSGSGSGSGC